jgi:bifunctional non-homologous end joining protein LigD
MSLREYVRKRDFQKTAEPRGKERAADPKAGLRFVIQKHDASRLHYDFRLEMGGTLKSWAVPKGVPFKKAEKRLAMQVEDHPVEYGSFEGTIPKGQYGAGTVMLWDHGTYEGLGGDPLKDLEEGKFHFSLHGEKLDGEWTLVRMNRGKDNEWLLIKSGADHKPVSKKKDDESIVSGRTMAEIAGSQEAESTLESAKPKSKKASGTTRRARTSRSKAAAARTR